MLYCFLFDLDVLFILLQPKDADRHIANRRSNEWQNTLQRPTIVCQGDLVPVEVPLPVDSCPFLDIGGLVEVGQQLTLPVRPLGTLSRTGRDRRS